MLTFSEYRSKLEEDLKLAPSAPAPSKKVGSMFPQVPNIISAHRAARAKWLAANAKAGKKVQIPVE